MRISIVVIVAENDAIGKDNALLWRLPDDLKYFKAITMNKPIVMGRKTYDSIGRPLPGRTNIVVTRQENLSIEGCVMVTSLEAALRAAGNVEEVMIVGGAEIYRQALPRATRLYLTKVHAAVPGDVFFPVLAANEWRTIERIDHAADERHAHPFSFITLERV